jgi:hypothetical protein
VEQQLSVRVGSTPIGSIQGLTQGTSGLDFTNDTSKSTCSTSTLNSTCTVMARFSPGYPGPRAGAVVFKDTSGNVLSTTYLRGIGTGPR